jgi:hypothetical protein
MIDSSLTQFELRFQSLRDSIGATHFHVIRRDWSTWTS